MMNLRIKANKKIKSLRSKNNKILTHKNNKVPRINNKTLSKNLSNKVRTLEVMNLVLKVMIHHHHLQKVNNRNNQIKVKKKTKTIILYHLVTLRNLGVKVKNKKLLNKINKNLNKKSIK